MLCDDADEALDGAQQRPVDHDGAVLLAVLAHILQVEALGHLEVQLDGAALPGPAQGIGQMEVQLRAVERAVSGVDGEGLSHLGDGGAQRILCKAPALFVANVVVRHGRQLDGVGQAERRIDLVEELDDILNFVLHLIPCHEDMRVVLREAAHAEQAVQRAGELMAVDQTELTDSERQVAVGVRLARVDHHAARAVHGLDGVVLAVDDGGVHVLLIVLPVAGALPQRTVEE